MKDKDFAKVYERNYKRSFLFAKSYVHDDLVAEDIAAESLFKYWQICKESEENVSEAMLVTILKNRAIDHLRRDAHRLVALEDMAEMAVRNLEIQISALEACDPNELFSEEIQRIVQETMNLSSFESLAYRLERLFTAVAYLVLLVSELIRFHTLHRKSLINNGIDRCVNPILFFRNSSIQLEEKGNLSSHPIFFSKKSIFV